MSKTAIPAVVFVDADSAPVASASNHGDRLAGALELLAARRITIVLCSRRTRAEIESVRQALGIFHPFICERGAAAYVPERYFGSDLEKARRVGGYQAIEFGASYDVVTAALRRVADRLGLGVVGFTEMSVEQVANECGLSLLEARLAKLREYGETFRLVSSNPIAERRFLKALEGAGLICTPFGAFFDAGTAVNAGVAADRLSMLYRRALGTIVTACAGGDEWSAQIRGRVDVGLDAPAGEPTRWLESIAGNIENIRAAAVVRPAARYAR